MNPLKERLFFASKFYELFTTYKRTDNLEHKTRSQAVLSNSPSSKFTRTFDGAKTFLIRLKEVWLAVWQKNFERSYKKKIYMHTYIL